MAGVVGLGLQGGVGVAVLTLGLGAGGGKGGRCFWVVTFRGTLRESLKCVWDSNP